MTGVTHSVSLLFAQGAAVLACGKLPVECRSHARRVSPFVFGKESEMPGLVPPSGGGRCASHRCGFRLAVRYVAGWRDVYRLRSPAGRTLAVGALRLCR